MKELRPYQEDAYQDLRATVGQGVRRIVVQAPTGSGKTRLAAEIVVGAQCKNNPLCFVVPAISLIDQTVEMFADEGIRDIGVIQADHVLTDWSKPVQIASIQTVRRRGAYPKASVVIFDEVSPTARGAHQVAEARRLVKRTFYRIERHALDTRAGEILPDATCYVYDEGSDCSRVLVPLSSLRGGPPGPEQGQGRCG